MFRFSLDNSTAACRRLTRKAHSSFVPAFSLLPKEKQEAMEILYAFDRFTDDIVDNSSKTEILSPPIKYQQLRQWVDILHKVFSSTHSPDYEALSKEYPSCEGIILLPALKYITDIFHIPVETYFQLTSGVASDIEPQFFKSFDESAEYCHRVATSAGIASLAIWGTTEPLDSPQVFEAAKNCGLAFQWTNILRDLIEDSRNGRIYLPADELNQYGFNPESFADFVIRNDCREKYMPHKPLEAGFIGLMELQIQRCETFYHNSVPLYETINADSCRVFAMMFLRYYKLFQKIKRNPKTVLIKRVSLSLFEKIILFLRCKYGPIGKLL